MPSLFPRSVLLTCLTVAAALGLAVLQPLSLAPAAQAAVATPATKAFAAGIDPYGSYQAQSTCSASVKPGVQHVKDVLNATYGKRTIGVVRDCSAGSTSEHKEGRALDWMISVRQADQKAKAEAFINWMLATDKFGNKHAMARRMGVMYVIWNNKMWRAYDPGRGWAEYNGCSASGKSGTGYDTTCHRDHVHMSFTWAGAKAQTSFYTGGTPFNVFADVNTATAEVGDTVTISGSVSPVSAAAGKAVAIQRLTGTGQELAGTANVDSSGEYRFLYQVTNTGLNQFVVYKGADGCTTGGGCNYLQGKSATVGVTVAAQTKFGLTFTASQTLVPDGWPVTFSGRVTPANVAAGMTLAFKGYDPDTKIHSTLGAVRVATDGSFSIDYAPPALGSKQYYGYIAGGECTDVGCAYLANGSSKVTVTVKDSLPYVVTASSATKAVPVGGRVPISGKVSPVWAAAGKTVAIRDISGGPAKVITTTTVKSDGSFSAQINPSVAGVRYYEAYKANESCVGSKCDFTQAVSTKFAVDVQKIRVFSSAVPAGRNVWTIPRMRYTVKASFAPASAVKGLTTTVQELKGGRWVKIGTSKVTASGAVSYSSTSTTLGIRSIRFVAPKANCSSGVCLYSGGTSASTTLRTVKANHLRFVINANASATNTKVGQKVTVAGTISSPYVIVGAPLYLRVLKGKQWVTVATTRVTPSGKYAFTIPMKAKGTFIYRVDKPQTGCSSLGCVWSYSVSRGLKIAVR